MSSLTRTGSLVAIASVALVLAGCAMNPQERRDVAYQQVGPMDATISQLQLENEQIAQEREAKRAQDEARLEAQRLDCNARL